ncbi:SEC-C domain-containing protein [Vibrio sp. Isolate30]|uniref:SEC-C metal-binding domain-containing protein n=1 Tax=Vibrio sp. Isolate30 TaxID=2908536 RepID=UPI001EFC6973|nr:SEC-C domain-containing protein [Vibrio sp. Isolate30]
MKNTTTTCPQCNSVAKYADFKIDRSGKIHISDIFKDLKKISSNEKLEAIKEKLAANDDIGANEFVDALVNVDPSFNKYRQAVLNLSLPSLEFLVTTIISLIALVLTLRANTLTEDGNEIMRQQIELSKQQFEYQKLQDLKAEEAVNAKQKELAESKQQIDALKAQVDALLQELLSEEPPKEMKKPKPLLKASLRNKLCLCGSGKKAKKCHPRGIA